MVKIQFKALIFKNCILLLYFVFLNSQIIKAQSIVDTNFVKNLYANAKVLYTSGDYDNAIKDLNKVLLLKNKQSNDINPEYFKVYNRLGLVYKKQGDLQKAIDFYKKAIENTLDSYNITFINDNIANINSLTGDYTQAIYYLENSLVVLEKSDKDRKYLDIIKNYHNQGHVFYKSGQINLALEKDLECIRLAKENNLSVDGSTYYNTGIVYQALDSLSKADFYFKEAIKSYINNFGENYFMTAMAYKNYATFYVETGQFEKSKQLYQKAYTIFVNSLGNRHLYVSYCLRDMGDLSAKKENFKEALNYYQESLISKIDNFNDSSVYANPGTDVFPDLDLLDILKAKARALEKLAEQESKEENLKAALLTLELTVGFIEQLRTGYLYETSKLQLTAKEHETYLSIISIANSLYEISGDTKYAGMAFKYAEHSRYAILRELKNEEMARGIAGVPDSIADYERGIKEQINSCRMQVEEESKIENPDRQKVDQLNGKIFDLTKDLEKLMQELESNYPGYYKQKYSNEVVSLSRLQKAMDKKEAILEYVLSNSTLYTFAVTRDTFVLVKQNTDSVFQSSLDFYKTVLHREHSSNYHAYRDAAYNLYKKLIFPVEHIVQNKNLLIIPDDQMNFISFDVLIDKPCDKSEMPDYRNESYLLRKYPISYAYSATLYANSLNAEPNTSPGFLGIAPSYENSKDSLQNLPLGLKSIKELALLTFGKSLTGKKATKSNFRKYSNKYDIIHFYAHGFEDTINPSNSKLCLSPSLDTTDDGSLYAWEIYNMQLNARLVVLASCYSGAGKYSRGEGVMSMGRSFINAGSETVITSLWAASYKPTITILGYFYRNLLKGMQKDEALRLAKLKYLDETDSISAHPRFWSGVIIIGNQLALYKAWYLKKIVTFLILSGLLFLIIKKRKSLFRFKLSGKNKLL